MAFNDSFLFARTLSLSPARRLLSLSLAHNGSLYILIYIPTAAAPSPNVVVVVLSLGSFFLRRLIKYHKSRECFFRSVLWQIKPSESEMGKDNFFVPQRLRWKTSERLVALWWWLSTTGVRLAVGARQRKKNASGSSSCDVSKPWQSFFLSPDPIVIWLHKSESKSSTEKSQAKEENIPSSRLSSRA